MEGLRGRNSVILLSVLLVCIAGIIIAFILRKSDDPAVLAKDLRDAYVEKYGVEPMVSVSISGVSEEEAKRISNDLNGRMGEDIQNDDDRYTVVDLKNQIIFSAIYK